MDTPLTQNQQMIAELQSLGLRLHDPSAGAPSRRGGAEARTSEGICPTRLIAGRGRRGRA